MQSARSPVRLTTTVKRCHLRHDELGSFTGTLRLHALGMNSVVFRNLLRYVGMYVMY